MPTREELIKQAERKYLEQQAVQKWKSTQEPKEESFLQKNIPLVGGKVGETLVRPAMQALGTVGGGMLGTAAGPAGTVVGGAGGYLAGDQLYKTLETALGDRESGTIGEELVETAKEVPAAFAMEMGGPILGKAVKGAAKGIPKLARSLTSGIYKVPKEAISRTIARPEQVKALAKEPALKVGNKVLDTIEAARSAKVEKSNKAINAILNKAGNKGKEVSVNQALDVLDTAKNKILKATPESAKTSRELDRYIKTLEAFRAQRGINGKVPIKDAQVLKQELQAAGYKTDPATGIKYYRDDKVGDAVRKASGTVRKGITEAAPETAKYNKELSEILDVLGDKKFKQAFKPENIAQTMETAGRDVAGKQYLQELIEKADSALDTSIKEIIEDYFASKFMEPGKILPQSIMGLATPVSIGASVGGIKGAMLGGAVSSPAVYRGIAPRMGPVSRGYSKFTDKLFTPSAEATYKTLPYSIGRNVEKDKQLLEQYRKGKE